MTATTWPPTWTLKPAHEDPQLVQEHDENEQPLPEFIHWAIGWWFAFNVGQLDGDHNGPLMFDAQYSGTDQEHGMTRRAVTPAQLREFARLLVNIAAEHEKRESR